MQSYVIVRALAIWTLGLHSPGTLLYFLTNPPGNNDVVNADEWACLKQV